MNFEQFSEVDFCRIYGLAVIEVMTLSRHLSNIDEMYKNCGLIHSLTTMCSTEANWRCTFA